MLSSTDLFESCSPDPRGPEALGPQAWLFPGFALSQAERLLQDIASIHALAPPRCMQVPGGKHMSVGISNAGVAGWTSDTRGYRYSTLDPSSGKPWPTLPDNWLALAQDAARMAGFLHYHPDVCLINEYQAGARMGLHRDRDEQDLQAPIVSVSLGMSATFQFGGLRRSDPVRRVPLHHGDVVVWGGVDRLRYHGVLTVRGEPHALSGARRLNLTFRKAL
ncbi:DNA oxidative demethylase AlkB [Brachymonas denitrificans]|uniref:DNA oxidative demethylase AlkB n=1 Tax=Brachymonas denitrificans TaxID=28220 RepID=UPI002AFE5843|nr:DNA oxidative demethylase AlkB [Brachymonas denitrificans]